MFNKSSVPNLRMVQQESFKVEAASGALLLPMLSLLTVLSSLAARCRHAGLLTGYLQTGLIDALHVAAAWVGVGSSGV
eukprot:CAMPEP_0183552172 /NCGR_PEP_ID=MMETSP0371-20130417/70878_1 /TAXON_ID=268820 /ORGANISM="Peridinium aciculiferum, Strain PAER-2" /LENGTH=77 /DNA_ID=CAMNT_0025757067 /DNA_START=568 /DNA_END=801 /DNA_ORIENTATION=+